MHGFAMILTGPVTIASLVVGFLINTWLLFIGKGSERSLVGNIGAGAVIGVVLWILLAWAAFFMTGHLPGGSMLSADFMGRAFSVGLAGVAAALVHRFGVHAFGWDAQHDRILDELLDMGLDAVYSDHVDRMVSALARLDP